MPVLTEEYFGIQIVDGSDIRLWKYFISIDLFSVVKLYDNILCFKCYTAKEQSHLLSFSTIKFIKRGNAFSLERRREFFSLLTPWSFFDKRGCRKFCIECYEVLRAEV